MLTQSTRSLLGPPLKQKTIPAIDSRAQLARVLETSHITIILLRHCNLFDLGPLLEHAYERDLAIYVNIDQINGIAPDAAGFRFLAREFHITGIVSNNPRLLALAKNFELETVQRLFAIDSTGLKAALDSVDAQYVDLLDISPALVIPYALAQTPLHLPFIGTGFIHTPQQVQMVLRAGAIGVTVSRAELWR